MSDNEIEDVSFLPGESLHRKSKYEPSCFQTIRRFACTRGRATILAVVVGVLILIIAVVATVSHCKCSSMGPVASGSLNGESLHRKSKYEPSCFQTIRRFACTRGRATILAVVGGVLILIIAVAATVSHCKCSSSGPEASGESLHRKSKYEPSCFQTIRRFACTRGRATILAVVGGVLILIIAVVVTVSHCKCSSAGPVASGSINGDNTAGKPTKQDYIATNGDKFPYESLRLPSSVDPIHYSIFLHPNITQSHFKGHVNISCAIKSKTDFIVFNSKELNISKIDVYDADSNIIYKVVKFLEYKTNEQIYVKLGSTLAAGKNVIISVEFEGLLTGKLAGFYKSSYKTKSGETRDIATTQFEATDARAAFPCFDEPALKATFQLTMIRDSDNIALFNMPLQSTEDYQGDLKMDTFQTSVKMSTYLVAFIVCDYEKKQDTTKSNITVSVYAPADFIDSVDFALSTAVKVLDYYEQFFNVKYPLPKQDLVAIPDFSAGAMENWGLITYRMTAVLYDPKVSSARNQQWVAVVIAHELAHQWFGNLVTMKWWNDLWLNEGFASYVEYIGSSVADASWKMQDQFVYETLIPGLRLDSLSNSHPINQKVENPNQINELFDTITYDKGASIIRMLSNFMGDDLFNKGLTSYLNTYKYSNAATADLWASLQQEVVNSKRNLGTSVDRMMNTWTEQMGYPMITLTRTGDKITVTQSRFLLYETGNQTQEVPAAYDYKWEVPFTYSTSMDSKTVKKYLLTDVSGSFSVPSGTSWIKGNFGMNGYFRVNYDEKGWTEIIKQLSLNHNEFTSVDRAGLIDDAFTLARAGHLKYKLALQLTQYMVHEENYLPWASLLENLEYIQARFEDKPGYTDYKKYMLKLLKNQLEKTSWTTGGGHLEIFLRSAILGKAVHLGHKQSVNKGKEQFEQWKQNHSSIDVNLKSVIYLAGIEYGTEDDWEMVWDAYQTEVDATEKRKLLSALGVTRDARLLSRLLDYCINETKVKSQDTTSVISMVTSSLPGEILAWRFLQQHWDLFYKRYGESGFTMSRLIKTVASGFDTKFDLKQIRDFFKDRDVGTGARAVKQSLEKIQINVDWLEKYETEITNWFKEHGQ